jgi:hypothetical protein
MVNTILLMVNTMTLMVNIMPLMVNILLPHNAAISHIVFTMSCIVNYSAYYKHNATYGKLGVYHN